MWISGHLDIKTRNIMTTMWLRMQEMSGHHNLCLFGKWRIWCEQVKWSNLLILDMSCRRKILTSYFLYFFQSTIGVGTLSIFIHKFLFYFFLSCKSFFLGPLNLGSWHSVTNWGWNLSVFHILMKSSLVFTK